MNTSFETISVEYGAKDEWLTPPWILNELGSFDLDPCSPIKRPWDTAKKHLTVDDMGLMCDWFGRVWLNPPYGDELALWMEKMAIHGDGIALTFARTETNAFHEYIWNRADSMLFIMGRVSFYHVDGTEGGTSGSPSVLIGYGKQNSDILRCCKIRGKFVQLK